MEILVWAVWEKKNKLKNTFSAGMQLHFELQIELW